MASKQKQSPCPCGGPAYSQCCARFIERKETAQTALELMRSRYTAYTLQESAYLQTTWHDSTRPAEPVHAEEDPVKWLGLAVLRHVADVAAATVEFVARYKVNGRAHRLHEVSRFVREEGRWFYVDGSFPESKKTI